MSLLRSILSICLLSCLCLVSCYKPLQLNYGIPDTSTFVGKLFQYPIPDNAFSGTNIRYKIENHVGKFLPSWLIFDERHKLLEGVPTPADLRDVYVRVKARDEEGDEVRDAFAIQVQPGSLLEPNSNDKRKCKVGENIAMLSLVIDKAMTDIPPKQRVLSMKNLAGYLGVETNQLTMLPQRYQDSNSDSILASGQGDVKRKRSDTSTVIMWQVGCEGEIWAEKMPQVERMKHIARDGTLSEVLQLPVMGWHIINNINPFRERRDIMNDGTRTSDEDGVGEEDEEEEDPDAIPITTTKKSILGHRHRHRIPIDAGDNSSLISGDAIVASRPSSISLYEKEATSPMIPEQIVPEIPYGNLSDLLGHTLPSLSTISSAENEIASSFQSSPTLPPDMGSTRGMDTVGFTSSEDKSSLDNFLPSLSTGSVPRGTFPSSSLPSSTTRVSSSAPPSTVGSSPESNKHPVIQNRLPKLPFVAGKPVTYEIPANTFHDDEDGDTRHLRLSIKPTSPNYWIQFNKTRQEIYALPLEEHVSQWMYDVVAADKHGAIVSDTLEIYVQHHRGYRSVTHEISLHLQMESLGTLKFGSMVDWQIFVYNILLDLYGNSGNSSYITVRSVVTNKEPYVFTYTNESLPRNECPTAQINNLLEVISNTTTGQAKPVLTRALGRLMTVKNITWLGIGHCEDSPPPPVVKVKLENQVPLIRNPIDHLEAISGELLVYHVPEDTFFDHEDGGTRKLKLHLMTMDRTTIPPTHWLQFDAKNQEFYGIPQLTDLGRREYQLVCKDSNGLMANDGLEVIVKSPGPAYYSASFSLTLARPSSTFAQPAAQRAFLEKLAGLFGDRNASKIVNIEFEDNPQEPGKSTVVRWANRTLASNVECPETTIGLLREVLLTEDDLLQESLVTSLEKDYGVKHASVIPTGICEGLKTPLHTPGVERKPAYSGKNTPANASVEYLITFVAPLVVIVIMLLCAALIACLLYRRRHTGKMSVGNGVDSGILIRSKGIPVIFQDELEERLEVSSGTKSPIILKEEKPPLPPPEYNRDKNDFSRDKNDYSRSQPNATTALLSDIDDASPYHPPPPIRPAPTYRLPPPYSPP
ncbi:hypothetical protein M8J75_004680 [Diaphorina citri]|nr:hypothetical protein M8J75_004680 [Diaphorina citri]